MPGIGKILLGFAVTLATGAALIVALRRVLAWLPGLSSRLPQANAPRVRSSCNVHAGCKLHAVEVEGVTVLIAEGRGSIAVTVMPARDVAVPPSAHSTSMPT
jgi:hypothetical protein